MILYNHFKLLFLVYLFIDLQPFLSDSASVDQIFLLQDPENWPIKHLILLVKNLYLNFISSFSYELPQLLPSNLHKYLLGGSFRKIMLIETAQFIFGELAFNQNNWPFYKILTRHNKRFPMKESQLANMLSQTFDETDSKPRQLHVFVLVNSNSGDRHGKQLIKKFSPSTSIKHHKSTTKFYVFDLFVKEQVSSCFIKIEGLCQANEKVSIIASGGDGTVQWVLSQSINHRVDFSKVIFSTIPFGTGNDFAASIGWEKYDLSISQKGLKGLAIKLWQCQIKKYDVWNCKIQVFPQGKITQIKNGIQSVLASATQQKSFTNYCGIGTDARISYFAQRINASSAFMKKIIYGIAGIWSFFTCARKLSKIVHRFYHSGSKSRDRCFENQLTQRLLWNEQWSPKQSNIPILPTDQCLTFLNSTSSMEIENIWQTPYSTNTKTVYKTQSVDDGLIEIVGYRNELSIALERRIHMACKLAQGEGPFTLLFNQEGKQECTYVHINGEPYKINNLRSLVISRNFDIQDGQIQVFKYSK